MWSSSAGMQDPPSPTQRSWVTRSGTAPSTPGAWDCLSCSSISPPRHGRPSGTGTRRRVIRSSGMPGWRPAATLTRGTGRTSTWTGSTCAGVAGTGGTAMTEPTGRADRRTVGVTGHGTAEAAPDMLTLAVGVECRRDTAGEAFAAAGEASAAVTDALRNRGVEGRDIRTSGLNVRADVVWQEGRGQQVTGYVASRLLSVRLRDLAASSTVIASAVEAGGNDVRLDGVRLGFADAAAVLALAREAAWADARAAAAQLAGLAGAELGEVVSVRQQPGPSAPVPVGGMQRAFAAESVAVEAGDLTVSTSVSVEWELHPLHG